MPLLVERVSDYVPKDHEQPEIRGADLVLRAWRPEDVASVLVAYGDPVIQRWHRRRFDHDGEAREWLAGVSSRWSAGSGASWAATENGVVVGQVALSHLSLFEGQAELSYWTMPAARGRGVTTRAATLVTDWAFRTARVHRMVLNHSVLNEASCRVAGRLGYQLEGTKRGQLQHPDGWHDMHLHARLAQD